MPIALHLALQLFGAAASIAAVSPPASRPLTESVAAARQVMMNDPAAALAIGVAIERQANGVGEGQKRQLMLAKAKWIAGEASLRLDRKAEARRLIGASYALSLASGDVQSQADALLTRGAIESESGNPAGALQDYLAAYRLFQRTRNARSQSIVLQNLAQLYHEARDFDRAGKYLQQAIEAYRGEPLTQLALANNQANLLSDLGRFSDAEKGYRRSVEIARSLDLHALEITLLSNLALTQIKQEHLRKARRTIDRLTAVSRLTGTPIGSEQQATIARLAFARKDLTSARRIIGAVLTPPGRKAPIMTASTHQIAYEIFKAAGEPARALAQLEISSRLRDEALEVGMSNKAALMAAQFDFAAKDLRIAELKAAVLRRDIALGNVAATRQRRALIASGTLLVLVLGMMSIWLTSLRRSRNRLHGLSLRLEQANMALQTTVRELGQRTAAEQHAVQLARQDELTGLPNRRHLDEEYLDDLRRRSDPGDAIFLLLLDLDRFKPINDRHGHALGDLVLMATADRLRSICSPVDAEAVRLGGDEFVVVMSAPAGDDAAERMARRLIEEIRRPIFIGSHCLTVGVSIGIAHCLGDGETMGDLLRAADTAMYQAKRSGTNRYCRGETGISHQPRRIPSIHRALPGGA